MTAEEELLYKRLTELAGKAERGGYFTFSDFLGLGEQSVFNMAKSAIGRTSYTLFGGAEGCERVMVRFGDEEELGYSEPFPIKIIKIRPKSPKYAEKLSHRDYLGSILSLGIERKHLGDIAIRDDCAYLFASETVFEYIASSLERIRHTDVTAEVAEELPDGELFRTERMRIQCSDERVDALIAKVFKLSREEAQRLFARRLVFISGRLTESTSAIPKPGEVVSVRGHGRFIYQGYESLSKKGKLNIDIDLYV